MMLQHTQSTSVKSASFKSKLIKASPISHLSANSKLLNQAYAYRLSVQTNTGKIAFKQSTTHATKNTQKLSFDKNLLSHQRAWLGLSRRQCQQQIAKHDLNSTAFAHWLSIPKLGLMLTFKHQECVEVVAIADIAV